MLSFNIFIIWSLTLLCQMRSIYSIDPGQGSYSCFPCNYELCGFADGGDSTVIDPPPINSERDFGPLTCNEIQYLADQRQIDPEMCSFYKQVTMSSSDPCDCKKRTSPFSETSTRDPCIDPMQPERCNLCGDNKIGYVPRNRNKLLSNSMYPVTCGTIYDLQEENLAAGSGGFSSNMCSDLTEAFARDCDCGPEGTEVTQCVPQFSTSDPCDPTLPDPERDEQCCVGTCQYLNDYFMFMCINFEGDADPVNDDNDDIANQAPPLVNEPTRNPTASPTRPPTSLPTRPRTPLPTRPPTPVPTRSPTRPPTPSPTRTPTPLPTRPPTPSPTRTPTPLPTRPPTPSPTLLPTGSQIRPPTPSPTRPPTPYPTEERLPQSPPGNNKGSCNTNSNNSCEVGYRCVNIGGIPRCVRPSPNKGRLTRGSSGGEGNSE